jgi:CheY-like chemotaxis protein
MKGLRADTQSSQGIGPKIKVLDLARLKKVLHVDDEDDILTIAKVALEIVGDLKVLQYSSGFQALEEAKDFRPDLFLLDYMMPGMDGEATYLRLREISGFENVPVIYLTARADNDLARRLKKSGALEIIAKPFDAILLCSSLHEVWDAR